MDSLFTWRLLVTHKVSWLRLRLCSHHSCFVVGVELVSSCLRVRASVDRFSYCCHYPSLHHTSSSSYHTLPDSCLELPIHIHCIAPSRVIVHRLEHRSTSCKEIITDSTAQHCKPFKHIHSSAWLNQLPRKLSSCSMSSTTRMASPRYASPTTISCNIAITNDTTYRSIGTRSLKPSA